MNLVEIRASQHDDVRLPSDVRAEVWFASLTAATVRRAREDRLLRLTPGEIALVRPIRRSNVA